jgi:hypothetical protein
VTCTGYIWFWTQKKKALGFCENGYVPLSSSKSGEFFDLVRKYVLSLEKGFSSMELVLLLLALRKAENFLTS